MAAMEWESTAVRAHIRFTSQRLGQLQAKLDADASITRKDIATLLQQGNVWLARAKAQKLIQEDALGDLMEVIEMEIGVLLEHFTELDLILSPSPVIAEALSSIIYTAPHIHCKELFVLRNLLVQRFGPDFAQSATQNRDQHVSRRIIQILSAPVPTASMLNGYLVSIARTYSVNWTPDPQRYDVVNILSEILNPEASKDIDIALLRKYCSYGIPDEPSWLRPRIWKLFLGLLPAKQADWEKEITKQREYYYDLVHRLLERYTDLDEPSNPLNVHDASLLNVVHHLSRIPKEMFSPLKTAPEELTACPLSATADKDVRIPHAFVLDERLDDLKEEHGPSGSSESGEHAAPAISISNYDADDAEDNQPEATTTIMRAYSFGDAHPIHCSALLRLLFIHANTNPGQLSPHIPALLIPIYTALQSEVEPEELAHVEADTFWLFEAIVAEFSELDEKEGSEKWMAKLDQTLAWADPELHENLLAKGLQPSLPHYSYRWLATVLTYTIPVPSIFLVWDALFSRLPRERESNPKLDFLVDLATSMLLAVRKELSSLHHSSNTGSRLWADEEAEREVVGKVAPDGDPFLEGISLLQAYPCTSIEDAERIIQTANDLVNRREAEARRNQPLPNPGQQGFGARLRNTMWKGFTNQVTHPDESSSESDREKHRDDGNETEKPNLAPAAPSWWGNIAAPRVLASTQTLRPPAPAGRGEDESGYSSSASKTSTASIWNYAEKLRDSDTAAALAKAGTNWHAKAISAVGPWSQDKPNNNGVIQA